MNGQAPKSWKQETFCINMFRTQGSSEARGPYKYQETINFTFYSARMTSCMSLTLVQSRSMPKTVHDQGLAEAQKMTDKSQAPESAAESGQIEQAFGSLVQARPDHYSFQRSRGIQSPPGDSSGLRAPMRLDGRINKDTEEQTRLVRLRKKRYARSTFKKG